MVRWQFAEVEAQSRLEVARMGVEVREAKADRDKAIRELHTFQLEAQGWKQEIVTTKAAVRTLVPSRILSLSNLYF